MSEMMTVLRSQGVFVLGGWTDTKVTLNITGTIGVASPEDVDMEEDADWIRAARVLVTQYQLYRTHANGNQQPGTSDIVVYNNQQFRVMSVFPYSNRGFWKAVIVRMEGD